MPEQSRPNEQQTAPNDASRKEQAEGSRENVNTGSTASSGSSSGGGITNRPLAEEEQEQQQLPPRGTNKEGGHA